MNNAAGFLAYVATSTSYSVPAAQFENEFLKLGLKLSGKHSRAFTELLRKEFFHSEDKKKGRERGRAKRAFWGLDKFFTDAQKTKNHFGGLTDRIGDVFDDEYNYEQVV